MAFLLETAHHVGGPQPLNIVIGIVVFLILVGALLSLQAFGGARPHSKSR